MEKIINTVGSNFLPYFANYATKNFSFLVFFHLSMNFNNFAANLKYSRGVFAHHTPPIVTKYFRGKKHTSKIYVLHVPLLLYTSGCMNLAYAWFNTPLQMQPLVELKRSRTSYEHYRCLPIAWVYSKLRKITCKL